MWTGDLDGFEARRDAVDAALAWVDAYGDMDGDGFVRVTSAGPAPACSTGLARTPATRCCTPTARRAQGPIALAETQGYVYYAKRRLAAIFGELGDVDRARSSAGQAGALKRAFNQRFWMPDEGFLRHGSRRPQRAGHGHLLHHRPRVVDAHRRRRPRGRCGQAVSWRRTCSPAGAYAPSAKEDEGLQPGELLQRQCVWPFDTAVIATA